MNTEEHWQASRAMLRTLLAKQPTFTLEQLVQATNRSQTWVKKWRKRLIHTSLDDDLALTSCSRARLTPNPPRFNPIIEERIVDLRLHPPHNLYRTPGPKTLLYFLQSDQALAASGHCAPKSTATIWKVLDKHGLIARRVPREHVPREEGEPMQDWQIDYKDASTVTVDANGKKQHTVEILHVMDCATCILIAARPREDYDAYRALMEMVEVIRKWGLPRSITFDRDPRFVGSYSGRDFPSAFVRLWHTLGVEPKICPPQRPDLNCYVERYHRSYKNECLKVHCPSDIGEVREVTEQYQHHYNYERPHQGRSCNNQPPRVAFPNLPALRGIPLLVDPDCWVNAIDGSRYVRRVNANGSVAVDKHRYYIGTGLAGQYVSVRVVASTRELSFTRNQQLIKRSPIKGLHGCEVSFDCYVELIGNEARSEQRHRQLALQVKAA